ncbi:nitrogen assimilation transcription factor nira [Colletotrichum truncatum]|uniref:Nitrogen assimilation transcription factor nira n=1 Tax=Colletotrichum truncatum TaxID=5467 RepID=A0ACC3Z6E6_COLTU|nr:nitrogen assimilation transcription factor nira [Colletotrichum truncatum]KAF6788107.1 nitrogen assimilation transcription factor nira [Colletotrichum truncatum]
MVDRAAFMEDLKSIDRDIANQRQSFCTPFLVNAMLAMGCAHSVNYQYSTGLKSNAEEGLRFSSEARRIIESECPGPSIPLLQTYCLLWFFDGVCGDGTLAVQYFNDACEVYRQLMGNFEGSLHPNQREQTRHRATLHALWGFWCTNAKSCLAFGEPAKDVPQPREGYRPTFPDDDSRYWFAYPVSLKPFDSHLEELFLAEQNLSKIVHDLLVTCQEVKRATSQIHKDVFAASYTRLLDWKAQLPNYLKVEESVLPSVMVLHSTFEVAAMILLEPMAMAKFPPLERQLDPVALSEAHAASAMAIIWKYRSMYSLRHEYWFCQGCVSAAKAVIQKLVPGTPYVDIFVKACQALREIGDNVNVANQYLRVIRALLTAHKVKLPKALVQYLTGLETLAGTAYIDKAYMSVDSKSVTKGSSSLEKDLFTVSELIQSYDDAVVDVE